MHYKGYNIDGEGWTLVYPWLLWPSPPFHIKWADITKVVTVKRRNGYFTVIKYEKNGVICQFKLFEKRFLGESITIKYYEFIKYICLMLPPEKTCLVTRELAGYDTKFKQDKYRQSELAYQETLVRQLWLQIRPRQALKVCNEILEIYPNSLWGMKVKASCLFEYIGDFVTARDIIEKMINLKYYDTYVIWLLVSILIEQKAAPDKVNNYMTLFRKQINYTEFALEFTLLNYYLDILGDYEIAQNLLKKLETEARGKIDPIYMKYVNEFYDKIAKLKAG